MTESIADAAPRAGAAKRPRRIALVGNPNTGKTTLFNALTGFRQRVGNYPGVTVERKVGFLRAEPSGPPIELVDLPGTYSLAARSPDEMIVVDILLGRQAEVGPLDAVLAVVDASNLRRNLYLTSQLLELGVPVVVALTMTDLAEDAGVRIDVEVLSRRLGVPVVPVWAARGVGLERLKKRLASALDSAAPASYPGLPSTIAAEVEQLRAALTNGDGRAVAAGRAPTAVDLFQVLAEPGGYAEQRWRSRVASANGAFEAARQRLRDAGVDLAEAEARHRYRWIDGVLERVVAEAEAPRRSWSDAADRVLTHPLWGTAILLGVMAAVFQSIYAWAAPAMDAVEGLFGALGAMVGGLLPEGALRSLAVNGVIAGVGGVLVFLPQILILFLFIGLLEDCGYMARAAMLFDRWLRRFGLSGKSFIPLLSSFACAVPGIMATRTIENRSERFITILVAPLMSCSARLPVYALLIAAFIPAKPLLGGLIGLQAAALLGLYVIGAAVAIVVALLLRRFVLKGESQAFLMELPGYKRPTMKTVLFRMYERGREFAVRAGTIIFAVSIVIWALGYYPRPVDIERSHDAMRSAALVAAAADGEALDSDAVAGRLDAIDKAEAGAYLRQSFLGRMGRAVEPVVEPLGWDWKIGMAAIASFPAREVVIAVLGTIYNLGGDADETSPDLREALASATRDDGRPVYNVAVAMSIMVFFALCCQCAATLATIKRETNSWRWPMLTFTYMTVLAYAGAFVTYRVVNWIV